MNKKHFLFLKRTSFRRPVNHNTIHQSRVFPSGPLVPVGWLHRGRSPVGGALSPADGVGHREHEPMFNVQEPFQTLHRCDVRRPSEPSLWRRCVPQLRSASNLSPGGTGVHSAPATATRRSGANPHDVNTLHLLPKQELSIYIFICISSLSFTQYAK